MSKVEALEARIKASKAYYRKVRVLRKSYPEMTFKQASGFVKKGLGPRDEIPGFERAEWSSNRLVEVASGDSKSNGQFLLVIADGVYSLLALKEDEDGGLKVTHEKVQVVEL